MTACLTQPVPSAAMRPRAHRSTRLFSLTRMESFAVLLLVVVAATAAYGMYSVLQGRAFVVQLVSFSACGMLVAAATVCLLIGRQSAGRCLRQVEQQLRVLMREGRLELIDEPVPEELRQAMGTLRTYVDQVVQLVERLRMEKKELDIRKRVAEAERRHTEAIICSISDAVLVIDSYGELALANTAAERVFGFRLHGARRSPISRVLPDRQLVDLINEARSSKDKGARREFEYNHHREGEMVTFKATFSPVCDAAGTSQGVVAVFHDMTREREVAQVRTDFVSAVSHELKTPLSSIKAYTEMLIDGEVPTEQSREDFYRIIDSETDRLTRLVDNVLDISLIESGVADTRRQCIDLNSVILSTIDVLMPQAAERQITLEAELGGEAAGVWANRDLLYQAVLNLAGNAIKYTEPGGHVRVRTSLEEGGDSVAVTIIDNGIGIDSDDLPRVFDKFYRTERGAAQAKGTGLGLNLVQQIVEKVHEGTISLESRQGVGTIVTVRLPIVRG